MKKKILMIAGGLALLALVLVNISLAFNLDGSSGFSLSALKMQIALADEGSSKVFMPVTTTGTTSWTTDKGVFCSFNWKSVTCPLTASSDCTESYTPETVVCK